MFDFDLNQICRGLFANQKWIFAADKKEDVFEEKPDKAFSLHFSQI